MISKSTTLLLGLIMWLTACLSGFNASQYRNEAPPFDVKAYFDGPIQVWGIVQDYKGDVINRFDGDLVGSWNGDAGTLKEEFRFYNGKIQHRTWSLKKLSDGRYSGIASDVVGTAYSEQQGNASRWDYVVDLPVGDKIYKIRFDDRMWLMNDGVLINRTYMKKFGITVGELSIFMKKKTVQ